MGNHMGKNGIAGKIVEAEGLLNLKLGEFYMFNRNGEPVYRGEVPYIGYVLYTLLK
jgi:hypothetical protein